jgi:hypothetical protein
VLATKFTRGCQGEAELCAAKGSLLEAGIGMS